MIKNLAITPPVLGRISIGRVVERNGKRLPEKDDQFTITTQVKNKEGWIVHPIDKLIRREQTKLRSIPITFLFNEPELNLRAEYSLFDRMTGRPMCVGNGVTCKRVTPDGTKTLPCPALDGCEMAQGGACKPYARLYVKIGDEDDLGVFIFRTTGYNSIRTLAARLQYFHAVSNGLIAYMPLELRLRGKSTTMSRGTPIYYADITLRDGMSIEEALHYAREMYDSRQQANFNQEALDNAARLGFANGEFEENPDEALDVLEEFYPEDTKSNSNGNGSSNKGNSTNSKQAVTGNNEDLNAKLDSLVNA